jgi:hypothetical protein
MFRQLYIHSYIHIHTFSFEVNKWKFALSVFYLQQTNKSNKNKSLIRTTSGACRSTTMESN